MQRLTAIARAPRITGINVAEDVIDLAIPRDSGHCMIADAIQQAVPGAKRISVDVQTIRFTDPDQPFRYIYLTPRIVQQAIIQFDRGIKPVPFSFALRSGQVVNAGKVASSFKRRTTDSPLLPKKAVLVPSKRGGAGRGPLHDVVGGTPPPLSAGSNSSRLPRNQRRQFGLRGFEL